VVPLFEIFTILLVEVVGLSDGSSWIPPAMIIFFFKKTGKEGRPCC
jgi:hypothetical protein